MANVYANTHIVVADIAGRSSAMDRTAKKVMTAVKASAARHRDTGDYMRNLSIETVGRGKDRLIVASGEGAVPIEFGGIQRRADGSVKVIKPLRIMRDAYAAVKRIG